jgi:hypothetical protein
MEAFYTNGHPHDMDKEVLLTLLSFHHESIQRGSLEVSTKEEVERLLNKKALQCFDLLGPKAAWTREDLKGYPLFERHWLNKKTRAIIKKTRNKGGNPPTISL